MGLSGTEVKIEIEKSDSSFIIMMPVEKLETKQRHKYHVNIVTSQLYVPVGTLTTPMYKHIKARLDKEKLHIPYRCSEITHHIFGGNMNYFSTDRLYSGSGNPLKLIVAFCELGSFSGTYCKLATLGICY